VAQSKEKVIGHFLLHVAKYFYTKNYIEVFFLNPKTSIIKPSTRVAGWFVFKPKIQIWVNFGGSCYGKCWYIL
jgi:hypothetical protein